jgi:transcriptional regulator with XRE-family HTH domain
MSSQNPLEVWRIERNLTKTEAAAQLGVATQYYHEWIKGRHLPNAAKAEKIKAVTGVSRADLLAWADKASATP